MQGYDIYIFLYFLIFLLIAFMPLKIFKKYLYFTLYRYATSKIDMMENFSYSFSE